MNVTHAEQEQLDSTWITEFKKLETEYNDFYKEIPKVVNVYNLYINTNNSLVAINKKQLSLDKKGVASKDTVIAMIQQNKKGLPNKQVELQTIIRYNFTLDAPKLLHVLSDELSDELMNNNYLKEIKTLDELVFKETIHFFSTLNAIYFIYKEKSPHTKHATTKKIYFNASTKSKKRRTRCKRT
jgi:hypothetical protein